MKGYTADEIVGKNFSIFYTEEAQKSEHPAYELQQAIKNGSYEEEGWRVREGGSLFWASVTITAIPAGGFVKVTRDLTERKQKEQELLKARDQAILANKLKAEFMASVTHEIRTPLSGVVGMAELLSQEPQSEEAPELARRVFSAAKRLLTVLNSLLDFSKLEAGKVQSEDDVVFFPQRLVADVIELVKSTADTKGLRLEVDIDLPEQLIGDESKIRQVLLNYVHNAVKFTDQGLIRVQASVEKESDRQIFVRFSVSDTGIGISQDAQTRLFEPFVQADGSISRRFGGTGLGLAIAKQLVALMKGTTGVRSEEGHGSTFWFVIGLRKSI